MSELKVFNNMKEMAVFYAEVLSISLVNPSAAADMLAQKRELEKYVQEKNTELKERAAELKEIQQINKEFGDALIAINAKIKKLESIKNRKVQLAHTLSAIGENLDTSDFNRALKALKISEKILNKILNLDMEIRPLEREIQKWFSEFEAAEKELSEIIRSN